MSDSKNDGGPAFPQNMTQAGNPVYAEFENGGGMTLRDWLAGMAMQGLLAADSRDRRSHDDVSRWAYIQADSMLAERGK